MGMIGTSRYLRDTTHNVRTIAVERAVPAQREWAARPYSDRAAVLRRAARLFEEHQQEIETWVVREPGRPGVAPERTNGPS